MRSTATPSQDQTKKRALDFYKQHQKSVADKLAQSGHIFIPTKKLLQKHKQSEPSQKDVIDGITKHYLLQLYRSHAKGLIRKKPPLSENTLNQAIYDLAAKELNYLTSSWNDAPCLLQRAIFGSPRYK